MITVKDLQPHPLDQVHRLIEPGPVILVTTRHRGIPNVMTNGFNMMVLPRWSTSTTARAPTWTSSRSST